MHSDWGGDYRGHAGDLLRWVGHCTFGTIFRLHGNDHRPWTYDDHTTSIVKSYLKTRYKLLPELIAGGKQASVSGFPLVARGDLFWPTHYGANSRDQYIWLNNTLVAPIWDSKVNMTNRSIWIPPGEWHDAYNGSTITGPANLSVSQPYERVPLYHKSGGLIVLSDDEKAMRVEEQDWSRLTIEAFPHSDGADEEYGSVTRHEIVERSRASSSEDEGEATALTMRTTKSGQNKTMVGVEIGAAPVPRVYTVRFHLRHFNLRFECAIDGAVTNTYRLLAPLDAKDEEAVRTFTPFGGRGARPPPLAGPIVEVEVKGDAYKARKVAVAIASVV